MKKEDVVQNIMATYAKYGVSKAWVLEQVKAGEHEGFSYQTIYTGLRMMLGDVTGEREYFTVAEMAEALGTSEDEIIQQIESMKDELVKAGEDPNDYVREVPRATSKFVVMPDRR